MSIDLFELVPPAPKTALKPVTRRPVAQSLDAYLQQREAMEARRREAWLEELAEDPTLVLFDELLEYLRQPLIARADLPDNLKKSDRFDVAVLEEEVEEIAAVGAEEIPYEPWGSAWVTDANGFSWSFEGVHFLQIQLFWESVEELALHNNEREKWSVLKWIFMPAIRKQYIWDKRRKKSHCLETHERDYTFSFHNCAMAARMDEEAVRDLLRQRLPAELLKSVMDVCTF